MDSVFTFKDYRKFLKKHFESRSKNGFGEAAKLARHLNVHDTYVSQVLKAEKSFSEENALEIANYLNLNDLERDYFLLLVQIERAGTKKYRALLEGKLKSLSQHAQTLKNRLDFKASLSLELQSRFYSDWVYSATRLATMLEGVNTLETLSAYLGISREKLKSITQFLVEANLLTLEAGQYATGTVHTYLSDQSPLIKSLHTNWRLKALEQLNFADDSSMHYSSPMTMARTDLPRVKEVLIRAIKEIDGILDPSPSEELVCLNIDWFKVRAANLK